MKLGGPDEGRYADAAELVDWIVLDPTFTEFMTIPAYALLD